MSGRLVLGSPGRPRARHEHVAFRFGGGDEELELRLRDPRRFGAVLLSATADLERHPRLRHLGPEPFDEAYSPEYLYLLSRGRRRAAKEWLMDARVVVGIGNIYANEILWLARVRPTSPVRRVGRRRWLRVHRATRAVLYEALAAGGTSLRDYADPAGNLGYFRLRLRVYGREGEPCCRCGRRIRRLAQGGRSTFFCAGCQR